MDQSITNRRSYAERRELFKNIWSTAMTIDGKDANIMNKPKVVKTLQLDAIDKCVIGKRKKQRIKNLRTVCHKILDFCDRQDADDVYYEKITAEGPAKLIYHKNIEDEEVTKIVRVRKKVKKAKSLLSPLKHSIRPCRPKSQVISSPRNVGLFSNLVNEALRSISAMKIKPTNVVKKSLGGEIENAIESNNNKSVRKSSKKQISQDGNEGAVSLKISKRKPNCRRKRNLYSDLYSPKYIRFSLPR